MDKFSFNILLILLCVLVFALIVLTFVGIYMLLRKNHRDEVIPQDKNQVSVQAASSANNQKDTEEEPHGYCVAHSREIAVAMCAICGDLVCDECHRGHDSLHFCTKHFETFLRYKWKVLDTVITTPNNPEKGLYLYQFKQNEWSAKNIPSYIMTHYKIDVESDSIESHLHLFVREDDLEQLKEILSHYHLGSSNQ